MCLDVPGNGTRATAEYRESVAIEPLSQWEDGFRARRLPLSRAVMVPAGYRAD